MLVVSCLACLEQHCVDTYAFELGKKYFHTLTPSTFALQWKCLTNDHSVICSQRAYGLGKVQPVGRIGLVPVELALPGRSSCSVERSSSASARSTMLAVRM